MDVESHTITFNQLECVIFKRVDEIILLTNIYEIGWLLPRFLPIDLLGFRDAYFIKMGQPQQLFCLFLLFSLKNFTEKMSTANFVFFLKDKKIALV